MTNTQRHEEFRSFILCPIKYFVNEFSTTPNRFIDVLLSHIENIRGEARNNLIEIKQNHIDREQFFSHLIEKLTFAEDTVFEIIDGVLIYNEIDRSSSYNVNKDGTVPQVFSYHIYRAIQDVKNFYQRLRIEERILTERKTSIPSFKVYNNSVLNDAFVQLKRFGFIQDNTPKKDFVNAFTGRYIERQLIWLKDNNDLAYLIRGIINCKSVYPMNGEHWLVTKKCFKIRDLEDYDTNALRNSDPPVDTESLNQIIKTFCTPID